MNTQSTFKPERMFFLFSTALALIGILFIALGFISELGLTFSFDTLRANLESDFAQIQSFFSFEDEEDQTDVCITEIKELAGAEEDERVLYVLKSGNDMTWMLNTREKDLYDIAYAFKLDHTDSDEYTIVKDAHDLVCEKATYGDHLLGHIQYNDDSQHSYGALCLDEGAVCAAYSKAMIFLCRSAGVDASYIKGHATVSYEPHGWALVKIEDTWYHSDPTWDDDESGISYDYFLLSDKEIEETRTWEHILYPSCPESFDFSNYN